MKTIVMSLVSLLVSLAMAVPWATPVMAADNPGTGAAASSKATLIVKAPAAADVGQKVPITIFSKNQNSPVANAGVYALKINDMPVVSTKSSYDAIIADYASTAKAKGIFLGTTDKDGSVAGKFADTGRYLLIAVKDGFSPGFTRISITLAAKKALNIKAPNGAEVGDRVTLTVTERFSNQPVAGAAVYARIIREIAVPSVSAVPVRPPAPVVASPSTGAIPQAVASGPQGTTKVTTAKPVEAVPHPVEVPRAAIASAIASIAPVVKANTADFEADLKTAEVVQQGGILLGKTDEKGVLVCAFKDDGVYMLAAIKADYAPGLAKIAVTLASQDKLGIKAPGNAPVNTAVTMFVLDRKNGKPVAGANVFALKITDQILSANRPFETIHKDEKISVYMGEKYAGIIQEKGIFLGETTADGQITGTFTEQGWYVLAAIKKGYLPGFHRIDITLAAQKALNIKAPASHPIAQPVTITVFDRLAQNVVEKASVYAVKANLTVAPSISSNTQKVTPEEPLNAAEAELYLSVARQKGIFLGETGKSGTVVYAFTEASPYVLVAVKEGYAPGFARINIVAPAQKILNINAPEVVEVNQPFTVKVVDMATRAPVAKADVFAIKVSDIPATATASDVITNKAVAVTPLDINDIKAKGILLGTSDENGAVTAKLSAPARYRLAAIRSDYLPGFGMIAVVVPATTNSTNK